MDAVDAKDRAGQLDWEAAEMTEGAHYRFPPASAYRLNRCLFVLKSDGAVRARYLEAPATVMDEMGLGPDERQALSTLDRDRLVALGAHPYLVFMAGLRLGMDRGTGAHEYF